MTGVAIVSGSDDSLERFGVAEVPGGWRVTERNTRGVKIYKTVYRQRIDAQARAEALESRWRKADAGKLVRRRAAGRCECEGECGRHDGRCECVEGSAVPGMGSTPVALMLIARNHDSDDLRAENMATVCQLCRQRHDDEEFGGEALFALGMQP